MLPYTLSITPFILTIRHDILRAIPLVDANHRLSLRFSTPNSDEGRRLQAGAVFVCLNLINFTTLFY
jgi:hypothetical protein